MAKSSKGIGIERTIGVRLVVEEYEGFIKTMQDATKAVQDFGGTLKGDDGKGFFSAATEGANIFALALGAGLWKAADEAVSAMWTVGEQAFNLVAEYEKTIQTINAMTAVELLHGETVQDVHQGIAKMTAKESEKLQQTKWDYDQLGGSIQSAKDKLGEMADKGLGATAQYQAQIATIEEMQHKLIGMGDTIDTLSNIDGTPFTYTTDRQVSTVDNMNEALREAKGPATEMIDRMTRLALISPFTRSGIMKSVEQGKAFGMTLKETETLTTGLTKFATVTGRTEQHIARITYAMGQTKSMGKLMMRQVRQMNLAGLSVGDMAAGMGLSQKEFNDQVGDGTIQFNELNEAMGKFFENTYGDAFLAINDSFRGLKNAIGDIKEMVTVNLFQGTLESFKPILKAIVHPFTKGEMLATIKAFGDEVGLLFKDVFQGVADTITGFALFFESFVSKISNPIKIKIGILVEEQTSIKSEKKGYEDNMSDALESGTQYTAQYMDNLGLITQLQDTLKKDAKELTGVTAAYNIALGEEKQQVAAIAALKAKLGDKIWKDGERGIQATEGLAGTYWALQAALGPANQKTKELQGMMDKLTASQETNNSTLKIKEALDDRLEKSGGRLSARYAELARDQAYLTSMGQTGTASFKANAEEMKILTANTEAYAESVPKLLKVTEQETENLKALEEAAKKAGASVPWLVAFRDTLLETHKATDPLVVIFDKLIVIFDKVAAAFKGANDPEGKSIFTQLKEYFTSAVFTAMATVLTFIADNIDFLILFFTNLAKVFIIIAGYGAIAGTIMRVVGAIAFLFTPMGILLTTVGLLSKAYETNFLGFKDFVVNVKAKWAEFVDDVKKKVKKLFEWGPEYQAAFAKLKLFIASAMGFINSRITKVFGTPDAIKKWFQGVSDSIVNFFKGIKDTVMGYLPTAQELSNWVDNATAIFKKLTNPAEAKPMKEGKAWMSLDNNSIYGWKDALVDVQVAYGSTRKVAEDTTLTLAENIKWLEGKWAEFVAWIKLQWDGLKLYFAEIGQAIVDNFKWGIQKIQDFFTLDILNAIKTVWNYKAEGKSGYEKSFEDAKARLTTFFGTEKYEVVISVTSNIVTALAGILDTIRLFFENEVPKAIADVFKAGFGQKDVVGPRPDFAKEQGQFQAGMGMDPTQAMAAITFIEGIGEKFRQWRDFATGAYTETKKAVEYLFANRDDWMPIALKLTALASALVAAGKIYNWITTGLAVFGKTGVGKLFAKWAPQLLKGIKMLFTAPGNLFTILWTKIGTTWIGSLFKGLGTFALAFKTWGAQMLVIAGDGIAGIVMAFYNGGIAISTGGFMAGVQTLATGLATTVAGMATAAATATGIIAIIAFVIAAVAYGFYTNFQGMTDNFWSFVDTLKSLWNDVLLPIFKSIWGMIKLVGMIFYIAIGLLWEKMLKGIFEDIAAAFNNLILILTWVIQIIIDLWNFLKPVLIPAFIFLAVIVGGILALVFIAIAGIVLAVIKIFSWLLRVLVGAVWVFMEAIKWIAWLAGGMDEAGREGQTLGDRLYSMTLIMGESGGIMGAYTDWVVTLAASFMWLSDWVSYAMAKIMGLGNVMMASQAYNYEIKGLSDQWLAGTISDTEFDNATLRAKLKLEGIEAANKVEKPKSDFWGPFIETVITGALTVAGARIGAGAAGRVFGPTIGRLAGRALGYAGGYMTATVAANQIYEAGGGQAEKDRLKAFIFGEALIPAFRKYVTHDPAVGTMMFGPAYNNPAFASAVGAPAEPTNAFSQAVKDILAANSSAEKMAFSDFDTPTGGEYGEFAGKPTLAVTSKAAAEQRRTENQAEYDKAILAATNESEVRLIQDKYKEYVSAEERLAAKGYKVSAYTPRAISNPNFDHQMGQSFAGWTDFMNRMTATPTKSTLVEPSKTPAQFGSGQQTFTGGAVSIHNVNHNTIYTQSYTMPNSGTTALAGVGAGTASNALISSVSNLVNP